MRVAARAVFLQFFDDFPPLRLCCCSCRLLFIARFHFVTPVLKNADNLALLVFFLVISLSEAWMLVVVLYNCSIFFFLASSLLSFAHA